MAFIKSVIMHFRKRKTKTGHHPTASFCGGRKEIMARNHDALATITKDVLQYLRSRYLHPPGPRVPHLHGAVRAAQDQVPPAAVHGPDRREARGGRGRRRRLLSRGRGRALLPGGGLDLVVAEGGAVPRGAAAQLGRAPIGKDKSINNSNKRF